MQKLFWPTNEAHHVWTCKRGGEVLTPPSISKWKRHLIATRLWTSVAVGECWRIEGRWIRTKENDQSLVCWFTDWLIDKVTDKVTVYVLGLAWMILWDALKRVLWRETCTEKTSSSFLLTGFDWNELCMKYLETISHERQTDSSEIVQCCNVIFKMPHIWVQFFRCLNSCVTEM